MKHATICSLVVLAVIILLLATESCMPEAEAQPLCPSPTPTPTPPPNPVTVTGFQASSPAISLPALIFGIVSTIVALVFAAWRWLHNKNTL